MTDIQMTLEKVRKKIEARKSHFEIESSWIRGINDGLTIAISIIDGEIYGKCETPEIGDIVEYDNDIIVWNGDTDCILKPTILMRAAEVRRKIEEAK